MTKSLLAVGAVLAFAATLAMGLAGTPYGLGAAAQPQTTDSDVPAYHAQPPEGPLPATLDSKLFDAPTVHNAYAVAARIKKLLYQQPCYCHCDRHDGHTSLLDCYVSRHASECGVCMFEAFYTYEQSHKGKTASEIRAGIIRAEYRQIDAAKYATVPPGKDAAPASQ